MHRRQGSKSLERNCLEDLEINEDIIKMDLKGAEWDTVMWIHFVPCGEIIPCMINAG